MSRDIVAIVVTYNRKKLLAECIARLLNQKGTDCDILIVDNASTDGTRGELEELVRKGKIIYLNTGKNIGGAGGFQFGLREAYKLGYNYFWLMDDDTFVQEDSLAELVEADSRFKGNYGFLSSVTIWKDGTLCMMNRQHIDIKKRVAAVPSNDTRVIMASFVSFFVRRRVVEEVGLPIKEFFIWADDLEYSRRISRKYPCYVVSKSMVTHYMEKNEKVGIETDCENRLWRYSYLYRNEAYVYKREGLRGFVFYYTRILVHILRVILHSKEKMNRTRIILKSVYEGRKFFPPIERV